MQTVQWERVLVSPLSRLQNHHRAEIHAGMEAVGWMAVFGHPVNSWDTRVVSSNP